MRILIVEDDNDINEMLKELLSPLYEVEQSFSGTEGLRLLKAESFDLMLLDLMLPGLDGEAVIKEVRRFSQMPIIVITAKADVNVLSAVLGLGANDFIAKPFNTIEVTARAEALLRQFGQSVPSAEELIKVGRIHMDEGKREVTIDDMLVPLTQKEYEMLHLFLKNPNKVFTKANLYETVWGEAYYGDDNTISVHISRLRSKLKKASQEELIETVWGVGFKLKTV